MSTSRNEHMVDGAVWKAVHKYQDKPSKFIARLPN